jgi:hypothetical protein
MRLLSGTDSDGDRGSESPGGPGAGRAVGPGQPVGRSEWCGPSVPRWCGAAGPTGSAPPPPPSASIHRARPCSNGGSVCPARSPGVRSVPRRAPIGGRASGMAGAQGHHQHDALKHRHKHFHVTHYLHRGDTPRSSRERGRGRGSARREGSAAASMARSLFPACWLPLGRRRTLSTMSPLITKEPFGGRMAGRRKAATRVQKHPKAWQPCCSWNRPDQHV